MKFVLVFQTLFVFIPRAYSMCFQFKDQLCLIIDTKYKRIIHKKSTKMSTNCYANANSMTKGDPKKKFIKTFDLSQIAEDPMDIYLESLGLWKKRIARDGSCLFRAVAEQVSVQKILIQMEI